jgi:hypothetical protein
MEPYLSGEVRALFDGWHQRLRARFERDLIFAEIRKGVQALSSLYVGRRGSAQEGGAIFDGAGKRAAFALYYAPLHFLVTWHVVHEIEFDAVPVARLWDLGCGTGAAGASWGLALKASSQRAGKIIGVDRSPFPLHEAEGTYRAFGLRAETQRIDLGDAVSSGGSAAVVRIGAPPGGIAARAPAVAGPPRSRRSGPGGLRKDDAVLLAYTANELPDPAREALLHMLSAGAGTSRPLLVIEPIAKRAAPWWTRWERALGEEALLVHSFEWRRRIELPEWIAAMDKAAGLDHAELTARVMGVVG